MGFSELLTTAVGFAGSAAAGGLFGILGSLFTGVLGYFKDKDERAFQLQKMAADREMVKLEADSAVKVAQANTEMAREQQDGEAFATSQREANQTLIGPEVAAKVGPKTANFVYVVEALLRLFRPAITIGALIAVGFVARAAYKVLQGQVMTAEYAQQVWVMCVDAIIFMAMTAFGWWFASRDLQKRMPK